METPKKPTIQKLKQVWDKLATMKDTSPMLELLNTLTTHELEVLNEWHLDSLDHIQEVLTSVDLVLRERIPQDYSELREDLNRLWSDCHLTNHVLIVDKHDDPDEPYMEIALTRNGERYELNQEVKQAVDSIITGYRFECLEAWSCGADCGEVLFVRTVAGVEQSHWWCGSYEHMVRRTAEKTDEIARGLKHQLRRLRTA